MSFITLPKATRGFWNVGVGGGIQVLINIAIEIDSINVAVAIDDIEVAVEMNP